MHAIVEVEEVHRANKKKFESVNKEESTKFYCGHLNPFVFNSSSIRLSIHSFCLFSSWLTHSNFSHVSKKCFETLFMVKFCWSHIYSDIWIATVSSPQTMPRLNMKKRVVKRYSASWQRAVTNFSINPLRWIWINS